MSSPIIKPKRKKTGGRPKGVITKNRQELIDLSRKLKVDVFEILIRFAAGDWKGLGYDSPLHVIGRTQRGEDVIVERIPPELRQKSANDAAKYVLPHLKAVEVDDKSAKVPHVVYVAEWGSKVEPTDDPEQDT